MTKDIRLQLSKPNEDVFTTANKNLVYSSAFNSLKIYSSGNVTATGSPTDISHSLGYEPAFLAYIYDISAYGGYRLPGVDFNAVIDNSKLRITTPANGDKIAYFIFYDPADTSYTNYTGEHIKKPEMKIAKPNVDVFKSSDTELSFFSDFNTLQIRQVFSGYGPTAGNTTTITHNFGYIPAFIAQMKADWVASYFMIPYLEPFTGTYIDIESRINTFVIYADGADYDGCLINIFAFTESLE